MCLNDVHAVFRQYKSVQVFIDCTEIWVQKPLSLMLNSKLYSNYKSENTRQRISWNSTAGAVTFLNILMHDSKSDKELKKYCGLLNLPGSGDGLMADKGFVIQDLL